MNELFGFPVLASEHGGSVDNLIVVMHVFMAVVFLIGVVFFAYPLVRYRKSAHPAADYRGLKTKAPYLLAVAMAIMDAVLLVFFSVPFWEHEVDAMPLAEDDPYELRVFAQQFQWYFQYPGPDGVFGATRIDLIDEQTNPIGLDSDDPYAKDDIAPPIMHLQVGRPAIVHLMSRDVIHSFNLTEFRVKQDVIPGMSIPVHFVPTMTTEEFREVSDNPERDFEIACAQLCGLGHYNMIGRLVVEEKDAWDAWYQKELEFKQAYEDEDDFWDE